MRYLLIPVFLFSLFPLRSQDIPRKANQISLTNINSAKQNFFALKSILADKNIEIANQDIDVFQIKTGFIPGKQGNEYSFIIRCRDSSIVISGIYKVGYSLLFGGSLDGNEHKIISNTGLTGSVAKKAFEAMNNFAMLFKTKEVIYEVSK